MNPTNIRDPDIPVTLGAFRALQDEVRRLDAVIAEVHSWIVCAAIADPEDMMQNAERIIHVTAPKGT